MNRTFTWALTAAAVLTAFASGSSLADTESVRTLVQQARARASQKQHREAVEILGQARMIAPNSEEVLSDYAENCLAAKDPVGAMNALEALSRIHPTVAWYPYLLGIAQLQVGDLDPSARSLRRSLELEPQRNLTLIALGLTLNAQKHFGEAKEVLVHSLELDPEDFEALAALAEAEEGLGQLEQAEVHADRALAGAGSHARAYFVLGKVRMSQDRLDEARDFFQKTIALTPDESKVHYQLSLAFARLNDPENSRKHHELYKEAKAKEEANLIDMRTRAGLGVGGMKL